MGQVRYGKPGRGTWILLAAKMLISAVLMVFLMSRIPLDRIAASLRGADLMGLAAAWTVLILSNVLGSYQWSRLLLVAGIRIPFWKVCAYYHVGLFFNNFLPANLGGDIARVMDASRYGPNRGAAISAVLMDRILGTVALAGLALLTTFPAIDRFHLPRLYGVLIFFFGVSLALVWVAFHPRLMPILEVTLSRIGLVRLVPHVHDMGERLAGFRGRRRLISGLLTVAVTVQLARIAVHVLVARALGIQVALMYFFLFVPLLAVIVSLPISLNGIGLREGAGVILFGLVGLDRASAFSLQFTTYLVAVAVSLLGGLIFLARIPRRAAEARNQRRIT